MNAKRQAEKRKPPSFYVFGLTRSGIEPRPPAPRADSLTTMLRGGGHDLMGVVMVKVHTGITALKNDQILL